MKTSYHSEPMFLGKSLGIARYDTQKYPFFEKLTRKQLGFFWIPEEIDCTRDSRDFKQLTDHEQHIFTSNLKRQILLDSIQGRAPSLALLPIASQPEIENWIQAWAFFETIHSRSYTHIIRNAYSNPSVVFDEMANIKEIVDCSNDINKYYDDLIAQNEAFHSDPQSVVESGFFNSYTHKKALWNCLMAINILEGIRFYVSFACSWNFAEQKKMEGNAKIIKFICRDENLHLAGTQQMLKILRTEDPDFARIADAERENNIAMFNDAIQQEKEWAKFLFKDGSMIGLNEQILCDYIDWIAAKRMQTVGLPAATVGSNPLPWTQRWIAGSEVQVAPQEVNTTYVVGGIKKDVDEETFKGFAL